MTAEEQAAHWNETVPIGTKVRYWKPPRFGPGDTARTRALAVTMGSQAVVWLYGVSGAIPLSHVELLPVKMAIRWCRLCGTLLDADGYCNNCETTPKEL